MQNRNKISKFGFFDIFVHIGENIQSIFSILQTSTTRIEIHVIRKKIKNRLKIRRVAIFLQFSLNKFWQQKFSFDFYGLEVKKFH